MTGYNGGTNHSATARSNERAARQERNAKAIDVPAYTDFKVTFSGVLSVIRNDEKLTALKDGAYRATIRQGYSWSILHSLSEAGAVIISRKDNATHVIVDFKSPAPILNPGYAICEVCDNVREHCITIEGVTICPVCNTPPYTPDEFPPPDQRDVYTCAPAPAWKPDEVLMKPPLMLPAPPALLMLPAYIPGDRLINDTIDGFVKHQIIAVTPSGVTTQAQKKNHDWYRSHWTHEEAGKMRHQVVVNLPGAFAIHDAPPPGKKTSFLSVAEWEQARIERALAHLNARTNQPDPEAVLAAQRENAAAKKANAKHTRSTGQRHNGRTVLGSV